MKRTILFGAGRRCYKFLIKYLNELNAFAIFDNSKTGMLCNIPIKRPYYDSDLFIIVTVEDYLIYKSIKRQLENMGYTEFENFIPFQIYNKKMAIAYGNCHMHAIKDYLEENKDFGETYGFYPLPAIQNITNIKQYRRAFEKTDLLFHQSIRESNKYGYDFSSKNVIQLAKEKCKIVAIPNLYGLPKCFFPQMSDEIEFDNLLGGLNLFTRVESNIYRWVKDGKTKDEVMQRLMYDEIYSDEYIQLLWDEFKMKLLYREQEWDIKISDYIFENYKSVKLFNDTWHISTYLAREIAIRILKKFNYNSNINYVNPVLDDYEVFIYNDVKRALGITFKEDEIRSFTKKTSCIEFGGMNFNEYVEMVYGLYTII